MPKFSLDFERSLVEMEEKLEALKKLASAEKPEIAKQIEFLNAQIEKLRRKVYTNLTPWQKVQIARHPGRPRTLFYIDSVFSGIMSSGLHPVSWSCMATAYLGMILRLSVGLRPWIL